MSKHYEDRCRVYLTRYFTVVLRWYVEDQLWYINVFMGGVQLAATSSEDGAQRYGVRLCLERVRRLLMWPQRGLEVRCL